jgi:hypothetical protein
MSIQLHKHDDPPATTWVHRIRLRVFALVVGATLVVIGAVSWAALPVWPVIGVAVATVAFVFNGVTSRLAQPVCWTCGADLARQQAGEYGVMCPGCGSLNATPDSPRGPSANA